MAEHEDFRLSVTNPEHDTPEVRAWLKECETLIKPYVDEAMRNLAATDPLWP